MKKFWFAVWCLLCAAALAGLYVHKCAEAPSIRPGICWQTWAKAHPFKPLRIDLPERIHPRLTPEREPSTPPRQPERVPVPLGPVPT